MPNTAKKNVSSAALETVTLSHDTAIKLKEFSEYYTETHSSPEDAKKDLWDLLISAMSNPDSVADHRERGDMTAAVNRCMKMIDFMFHVSAETSLKNLHHN